MVQCGFTERLDADRAYADILMKNPLNTKEWHTTWTDTTAYDLSYLADFVHDTVKIKFSEKASIKLNGEMLTLKRIQSDKTTSTFKNNDISITTIQSSLQKSNMEEEGNDVKLSITIRARNSEKKFYLSGYCGI
ncbi:TPA: replication initiation protein [Citrobacter amalonaticus]|uniref:replication initiation protein n=1 Tax=Citrobacter amalonaticus TaxID=35703 RepID=UPI0020B81436|nr:replication initiation protein [Citrobacter amalonaticus]